MSPRRALLHVTTLLVALGFTVRELVYPRGPAAAPCAAPHVAPAAAHAPAPGTVPALTTLFQLPPEIKRVVINVGSWLDPPVPTEPDMATIAIEPNLNTAYNVRQNNNNHPRVFIVTAAISDRAGFANFFTYNVHGASSSLAPMSEANKRSAALPLGGGWARDERRETGYPPVAFVPVLTLTQLLDAIPPNVTIVGLKTDMQGFDFVAVSSAGAALRRVEQVFVEMNCHGFAYNPDAPQNDYDVVWKDFMPSIGFALDARVQCPAEPAEANGLWIRDDYKGPLPVWWLGALTGAGRRA